MALSYRIDPAQKVVYTTLEGEVTDEQLLRHAEEIVSDPEVDDSFVELMHAETTSMEGVTGSGIQAAANVIRGSNAMRRIAIVASRDIEFGLARMVQLFTDESFIEIRVFREQADARSWLGLD